jgi:hypothetical protein
MKNILGLFCLVIISFGCANPDQSKMTTDLPPDKETYNVELYFDESSGLVPLKNNPNCKNSLDDDACQMAAKELRNSIIEKIRNIDETIVVDTMHVRVTLDVSVYLDKLNKGQFKKIEAQASTYNYTIHQTFDIQIRRPIMQTDNLEQARRPIMQEQLRYDPLTKTSLMIKEIGGGQQRLPVPSTRVWIVDTGIDSSHPDLIFEPAEVALSKGFTVGNPQDKNPFIDNIGHGTFLAGVIGGFSALNSSQPSSYGVNGVFPKAKMVSIKIFEDDKNTNNGKLNSALSYVYSNAMPGDVVNISWGLNISPKNCGDNKYKTIYDKIEALATKGVYVVMSAGNESKQSMTNFPGCMDLATSPSTVKDKIFTIGSIEVPFPGTTPATYYYSIFSNYGRPSIDYLTPGEDVFTTAPGGNYVLVSGTSISAAIFSGILYHNPNVGTLESIKRGAAQGDPDPDYPIAKVVN